MDKKTTERIKELLQSMNDSPPERAGQSGQRVVAGDDKELAEFGQSKRIRV